MPVMPAGVTEAKAALRRKLAELPAPDWDPLMERFLALPEVERAQTILLFYGVGKEPDTGWLIQKLLRRGKRVLLPRCLPERQMEARLITDPEGLRPGAYGIPEPDDSCPAVERDQIDLILVPNLCCDKRCDRLGRGGGYYDRYLAEIGAVTVALCPEEWLQAAVPTDEHDVPVDVVLTQTQTRRRAEALCRVSGESG